MRTSSALPIVREALGDAERQLETVLGRQEAAAALDRKTESLGETVRQLSTEFAQLSGRRADVDALAERLARVEAIAREAEARQAGLEAGREHVEQLRAQLEGIHTSHATAAELCRQLTADRSALEAAGANIARFTIEAPAIENQVAAVLEKFRALDQAYCAAEANEGVIAELDATLGRSSEKLQFVEKVERRLN